MFQGWIAFPVRIDCCGRGRCRLSDALAVQRLDGLSEGRKRGWGGGARRACAQSSPGSQWDTEASIVAPSLLKLLPVFSSGYHWETANNPARGEAADSRHRRNEGRDSWWTRSFTRINPSRSCSPTRNEHGSFFFFLGHGRVNHDYRWIWHLWGLIMNNNSHYLDF